MTPEILTMLGIGIAIIGLLFAQQYRITKSLQGINSRIDTMNDRIDTTNSRTNGRIDDLRDHIDHLHRDFMTESSQLRERVAKVEGLLEGIRDTITKPQAA